MIDVLSKKEKWRTRYLISVALLAFFAFEYDRIISTCMSTTGCREGLTTEALISGTEQGLFWSFAVVILGRAAQPLINRFALFKLGANPPPDNKQEGSDAKSQ